MDFPPITLLDRVIEMVSDPYFWLLVVAVSGAALSIYKGFVES